MYSVTELSMNFMSMSPAQQEQSFQEIHTNIHLYSQMMPDLPLIKYITHGETAVPRDQHGPIINAYKAWAENQT